MHHEIAEKMIKRGWPRRHCIRAASGNLTGPSVAKIDSLWERVKNGDCLIVLAGNRGPGKTQMAVTWAYRLASNNQPFGRYVKLVDMITEIKSTWKGGMGTEQDTLRKYRTTPYLVIDEMQEIAGHDFELRYLTNIIDHRYDDMLATVIIGNLDGAAIEQAIPASILDRANETGGLMRCDWASYRS